MKRLKLITLLLLSLTLTYCSSDDDSNPQEQNNEQEDVVLNADLVSNGIIISGASKIDGSAPQPNNAISFSLNDTSSALLNEGFDIDFQSPSDIAGAYLIISDIDGNDASNYYDIPASAFGFTGNTEIDKKPFSTISKRGSSLSINIGFNNSVPVGRFCYILCVYDDNGNISNPQTVCITVESWGGNSNLVALWNLSRYQDIGSDTTIDVGLNEEYCYPDIIFCDNGSTLNYEYCSTYETFYMDLKADGSYTLFLKEIDSDIDYEASTSSCTIVDASDEFYEYTSQGNWAYNDTNEKLVLAEYYSLSNENGEIYEENLGQGNAYIVFDDFISISGNTLVMTFDYGDGEFEIYTFQK